MDDLTFYSMLGLLQGGMWLSNDVEQFLSQFNISHSRFSILLSLLESSDLSMLSVDISRKLGLSKPTISKLMLKLEADNFVVVKKNLIDGRSKSVSITAKGKRLLDRIIPEYSERIDRMSKALTDAEKETLMKIILKIDFLDPAKKIAVKK